MSRVKRAGELTASTFGALAIVVSIVVATAFMSRIREEYYIGKLEKGSEEEQRIAIQKLVEMKSLKAVPSLAKKFLLANQSPKQGKSAGEEYIFLPHAWYVRCRADVRKAILSVGPAGVQALATALQSKDRSTRIGAAYALGEIGGNARDVLPALRKALDDADEDVRWLADGALLKIQRAGAESRRWP